MQEVTKNPKATATTYKGLDEHASYHHRRPKASFM